MKVGKRDGKVDARQVRSTKDGGEQNLIALQWPGHPSYDKHAPDLRCLDK